MAAKKTPRKEVNASDFLEDLKDDAEKTVDEVVSVIDDAAKKLEGKTVQQLKYLHDEAVVLEDAAKKYLHILRQRAVNLATTVDDSVDKDIIAAKAKIVEAEAWVREIELRLEGEYRDIWGSKYGRTDKDWTDK
jgi:hypothetical protein